MKKYAFPLLCCAALMLGACANSPSQANDDAAAENATDAEMMNTPGFKPPAPLQYLADDAPRLENGAYEFTALLPLFPDIIAGTGKQTSSGENYKMGAAFVASATASYSLNDRRFSVSINDAGNEMESILTLAKWSNFALDEETESEIQRTMLIQNQPAFLHYDKPRRAGSLSIVHKGRFVIDISGRNVEIAELESALADLHIERLK